MQLELNQKPDEETDLPVCDLFKGLEHSILSARDKLLEIRKDCVKYTEAIQYIDNTVAEINASLEDPLKILVAELHLDAAITVLKTVPPNEWIETLPMREALEKVFRFLKVPRSLAVQKRVMMNIENLKHSLNKTGNKFQVSDLNIDLKREEERLKIIKDYITGIASQGIISVPESVEVV